MASCRSSGSSHPGRQRCRQRPPQCGAPSRPAWLLRVLLRSAGVRAVTRRRGEATLGWCFVTDRQLRPDAAVYVAGHRGLVGSAVWRHLQGQGFSNLLGASSSELDLRDQTGTRAFFEAHRPEVVVLAAAKVGGILANDTYPADFLGDNLRIQVNVLEAARAVGVERLLLLGSSCIYPKFAPQPMREDALLTGTLEPTNDAYAIARSPASSTSKRCADSTATAGSRPCRPTSTAQATTSTSPA